MAPTEATGLLPAEVEDKSDSYRSWHAHNARHTNRVGASPGLCLCILPAMVAAAIYVVLFTTNPLGPMTPEEQVARLNSETEKNAALSVVPSGCTSTLVLMRHCEKHGSETQDSMGNEHCSKVGYQRAEFVPTLFGDDSTSSAARWPLPKHLYAMSRGRPGVSHLNYREIETLDPLREKSGVEIDTRFSEGSERHLADDYFHRLASGNLCGSVTVINWKHSRIPTMAVAVGCSDCPEKYKKNEYDKIWEITYEYDENSRRALRKKEKISSSSKRWSVKGTVVKEGFKPPVSSNTKGKS